MTFVADILEDRRPDDGVKVVDVKIKPAASEVIGSPNSSGNTNGSGTDGDDTFVGTKKRDVILGGDGKDTLSGGASRDLINGQDGKDSIEGNGGNDALFGGSKRDVIKGGTGNDIIVGGGGDDSLIGGRGNDFIFGGKGDDLLRGGKGNDVLEGGEGADTFVFKLDKELKREFSADVIADFVLGTDILDISDSGLFRFDGVTDGSSYVVSVIDEVDIVRGTLEFIGLGSQIADMSGASLSQMTALFS